MLPHCWPVGTSLARRRHSIVQWGTTTLTRLSGHRVIAPPLQLSAAWRNPHKPGWCTPATFFPNKPSVTSRGARPLIEPTFNHRNAFDELGEFSRGHISKDRLIPT